MTTTLATPQVLASLRGVTYDPTDLTQVLALEAASDAARSYCGQTFDLVEGDVVRLDGTGTDALLLPQLPVTEVAAVATLSLVTVDGVTSQVETALETTDWYPLGAAGILYRRDGACWPLGYANVQVTYSHGYVLPDQEGTNLPADLQLVVAQMAARIHASPDGRSAESETVGSYSVTYGGGGGSDTVTILPLELTVLGKYRQRRLA